MMIFTIFAAVILLLPLAGLFPGSGAGMTVTEVGRALEKRRWLARALILLLAVRIGRAK